MAEAAGIIGRAIGRPQLSYARVSSADFAGAMVEMGAAKGFAGAMAEMADAINSGHVAALEPRSAKNTTPTSYETWVKEEFAPRFLGKQAGA
jgi:hypothetical protein